MSGTAQSCFVPFLCNLIWCTVLFHRIHQIHSENIGSFLVLASHAIFVEVRFLVENLLLSKSAPIERKKHSHFGCTRAQSHVEAFCRPWQIASNDG
jgi:hypothetical protein